MALQGSELKVLDALYDFSETNRGEYLTVSRISQIKSLRRDDIEDCFHSLRDKGLVQLSTGTDDLSAYITAAGRVEYRSNHPSRIDREEKATSTPARITPKGWRSFDQHDADFFLRLLPGPYRPDGLPESIHFWKIRIEETDRDKTFSVGVIEGPSGCGKSSLVRAGLLPRLAKSVISVDIEAAPQQTEGRLLRGLLKQFPNIPPDLDLQKTLIAVRERITGDGKKLLLVIDQFEQWLGENADTSGTALVSALSECDGRRLQAIVMVRDDFRKAMFRFQQSISYRTDENRNYAFVDLFARPHARKVLEAFGRGYEILPDDPKLTTKPQNEFLEQAIEALSKKEGRVRSVRLSLFAEMLKDDPWIPATLTDIGGADAVGETFLRRNFSEKTAPKSHRDHQDGAKAVLKALLPEAGSEQPEADSDVKGQMKSYSELRKISGYDSRSNDFDDLLKILDTKLHLITTTYTDGAGSEQLTGRNDEPYYQLTHDQIVRSLRNWVTNTQRETYRGRAELLLEDRESFWRVKPENRFLPSTLELCRILVFTRGRGWSEPQKTMMKRAGNVRGRSTLAVTFALALFIWGGFEVYGSRVALPWAESIRTASLGDMKHLLEKMAEARGLARLLLVKRLESDFSENAKTKPLDEKDKNRLDQSQAMRALALTRLGWPEKVWPMLQLGPPDPKRSNIVDPSQRSYIVNWAEPLGVEPTILIKKLEELDRIPTSGKSRMEDNLFDPATSQRRALILALGAYPIEKIAPGDRESIIDKLLEHHRDDPDAGVHGAAEWTLRQWKQEEKIKAADAELKGEPRGHRRWFVNKLGQTFAIIDGPVDFQMGTPKNEDEIQHPVRIPWQFAIAAKEVSKEQWQEFMKDSVKERPEWAVDPESVKNYSPDANGAMVSINWFAAAAFCDWLSGKEGLRKCYDPLNQKYDEGMTIPADVLHRNGYRLPTEAEWEYACRSGTTTSRQFGDSEDLLGGYARYFANSANHAWLCGSLRPNDLGFFDLLGNAWEWVHDEYQPYGMSEKIKIDGISTSSTVGGNPRLLRGGTFGYGPAIVRSALRIWFAPTLRLDGSGFRPSRTYP